MVSASTDLWRRPPSLSEGSALWAARLFGPQILEVGARQKLVSGEFPGHVARSRR